MIGDLVGQSIRGYEILEEIGSGGFGVVYRANQSAVDREMAIKVILPERAKSDYFVKRFDAEAHLVANLEHPYIVPLYDYWQEEDRACLVMRWLYGGSLWAALSDGAIESELVTHLMAQIGDALSLAHQQRVVHLDIKSDAIFSNSVPQQALKGAVIKAGDEG